MVYISGIYCQLGDYMVPIYHLFWELYSNSYWLHPSTVSVRRGTPMQMDMATARSTFATGRWGMGLGWRWLVSSTQNKNLEVMGFPPFFCRLGIPSFSINYFCRGWRHHLSRKTHQPTKTKNQPPRWFTRLDRILDFPDSWRVPNIQRSQTFTFPHSISKRAEGITRQFFKRMDGYLVMCAAFFLYVIQLSANHLNRDVLYLNFQPRKNTWKSR